MSIPGIPFPVTPPPRTAAPRTLATGADLGVWLARAAALVALAIAGYLTYASLTENHVAGCDDTSEAGCGHVLSSRWATWLGIPVALPAVLVYLATVSATWMIDVSPSSLTRRTGWTLLATTAVLVGGAAIWFVGLQFVALGNVCWYCLTLHACGLFLACFVAWRLPQETVGHGRSPRFAYAGAGIGAIGVGALVAGQLFISPQKPEMKLVEVANSSFDQAHGKAFNQADDQQADALVEEAAKNPAARKSTRIATHPWVHRRLSLLSGTVSLDMYDYPVIGDREAHRSVAEVFDYTCPQCRDLSGMMRKVHAEYGDQLALVLVPIPMNPKCNRFVKVDHAKHATACELARLAIAVWQTKPEAFEGFHVWLMNGEKPPTPEAAGIEAARRVGTTALKQALADPAVDEQMQENCRIYALARDNSRERAIPKLLFLRAASSGVPSSEQLLRSVLEKQGGLKPAESGVSRQKTLGKSPDF